MRDRPPGRAVASLLPLTPAAAARCLAYAIDANSSDGCADDAAAPVGANADRSCSNSAHSDGPGVARSTRNGHCHSDDRHAGHNRSPVPGSGRGCLQNDVRDIRDPDRHDGHAQGLVARLRQSAQLPPPASFSSSCSPRLTFLGSNPSASMCGAADECRPNVPAVLSIPENPPLVSLRSPLDAMREASGREEALLPLESGPRRGRWHAPATPTATASPPQGQLPRPFAAVQMHRRASR